MRGLLVVVAVAFLFCISCDSIQNEDASAVRGLAFRVLGEEDAQRFFFSMEEDELSKDAFTINFDDDKILIDGNSNIALASGLNWYLKYYTNSQISWDAKSIRFPEECPEIVAPTSKVSSFTYSYYLNYCTFNYSMAFWDWKRWEKEIDWMALNGINLPLAIVGTEAIWRNTLQRLNFSKEDIDAFIPGPAFNAWWLMGNLEGWGGPLSDEYIDQQVALQQKILNRMRELGMNPVLPGFFGMVPTTLKKMYPEADIRDQGHWAGGFQRPAFLSPTDPLFKEIAAIYYEELQKLYGDITFFSGDPFHEGGNTEGIDLPLAGENIIHGMEKSFPDATWVFQGWHHNPRKELLSNIDDSDVIILDLDCDNRPQWEAREGWDDKPWIWNAVVNFGGNVGMFGRLDVLAKEPFRALSHPAYADGLSGIGAMMEGIENNYVVYDLLFELKWHHQEIELNSWLDNYVKRRYGTDNKALQSAWQILRNTVYGKELNVSNSQQGTCESILCARPAEKIERVSTWGSSELYYEPADLLNAWKLFAQEANLLKGSEGFQYDFLDVTRQVLANYAQLLHQGMMNAYTIGDQKVFEEIANEFLQLLDDQNRLLNTHPQFMLGAWIEDARSRGTTEAEKDLFEFNARTQITTWSFQNSNLHEYSHREWAGLLADFYKPRWEMFIQYLEDEMDGKEPAKPDYYAFEKAWIEQTGSYNTAPTENPVDVSVIIFNKYYQVVQNDYSLDE